MIAHYHKTYTWTYFIPLMKMDMWIIPFIKINQCWYDNTYANSVTFLLAISIAYVAWIVTHEEVFKEPWEYCSKRSTTAKTLLVRKFFLNSAAVPGRQLVNSQPLQSLNVVRLLSKTSCKSWRTGGIKIEFEKRNLKIII